MGSDTLEGGDFAFKCILTKIELIVFSSIQFARNRNRKIRYWLDPALRFGGRQWQKDKKARQLNVLSRDAVAMVYGVQSGEIKRESGKK